MQMVRNCQSFDRVEDDAAAYGIGAGSQRLDVAGDPIIVDDGIRIGRQQRSTASRDVARMAHRHPSRVAGISSARSPLNGNHFKRKRHMPTHPSSLDITSIIAIIEQKNGGVRRSRLCRQGSQARTDSIDLVPHGYSDDDRPRKARIIRVDGKFPIGDLLTLAHEFTHKLDLKPCFRTTLMSVLTQRPRYHARMALAVFIKMTLVEISLIQGRSPFACVRYSAPVLTRSIPQSSRLALEQPPLTNHIVSTR